MAFRDKTIMTPILPTGEDVPLYNINTSVGKPGAAANRRDDVLMVQYFLKLIYASPGYAFPAPGVMVVDGVVGPVTQKFIRQFQIECEKYGSPVVVDGQVDRVPPVVMHKYSLGLMNRHLGNYYQHDFGDLSQRSDCPPELAPRLRRE